MYRSNLTNLIKENIIVIVVLKYLKMDYAGIKNNFKINTAKIANCLSNMKNVDILWIILHDIFMLFIVQIIDL